MKDTIKPTIRVQRTKAFISPNPISYNEQGITYNQIGLAYGGISEYDIKPSVSLSKNMKPQGGIKQIIPSLKVNQTKAHITTQTYSYNESGYSYNQINTMYGGIYGYAVSPLMARVKNIHPTIHSALNIAEYVTPPYVPPGSNSGQPYGLLLVLTQP